MTTIRVLVVEDSEADQEWIRRSLAKSRSRTIETVFARSLDEATHKLRNGVYDGMFLDLGLPDSHALFTVTHIRSNFPEIPVVVLSGTDDESITISAMRSGAQEYLVKSEETRHLLERALISAIERNRAMIALRMNQFRDAETQFLAEPAFRMMADAYLESAGSTVAKPRLMVVQLSEGWNRQAQFTLPIVDQVATALTRTAPDEQLFCRLRGDLFAVLIKDGRRTAKDVLIDRFQQNLRELRANSDAPEIDVAVQVLACRNSLPAKLESILSEGSLKAMQQTA